MSDEIDVDVDSLFEDENTLKDEMSDEEFREMVQNIRSKREELDHRGRDGSRCVFAREFEYRGISFVVTVKRYFRTRLIDIHAEIANDTNKWAELTYPEESEDVVRFVSSSNPSRSIGFLEGHTTHMPNDGQSLKTRFEEMVEQAKDDIDWFLDEAGDEIEKEIERLRTRYETATP